MFKIAKKKLKDQKGFTLIELLAVIVILGIIAAIAIPSILGLINNSKKDAVVADGQQMVSAARNAVASNDSSISWSGDTGTISLDTLIKNGYLENLKNPYDNSSFDPSGSVVTIDKSGTSPDYHVTLIQASSTSGSTTSAGEKYLDNVDYTELKRENVN